MLTLRKLSSGFILVLLFSVSINSQTRKLKSIKSIEMNTPSVNHVELLIPKTLFSAYSTKTDDDSVTIAEILFNPEINLINPDTFKLETSFIQPDSSLLNRDSARIIDVHAQDVMQTKVLNLNYARILLAHM